MNVNEIRYVLLFVSYPIILTNYIFEVTTAPLSAANIRLGVYAADTNMQPTGTPLYDSGSIAVASGFTGTKTGSGLSISLGSGVYLVCANVDTSMVIRTLASSSPVINASMGASSIVQRFTGSQTYGSLPNTPTAWTSVNASAGGLQNFVSWQWTE